MKQISIHGLKRKALRKYKKGGIEGLPLQLMIIIMVATLGTAIIVGWMGNIEEPHSINKVEVESDSIDLSSSAVLKSSGSVYSTNQDVIITVYDQNGNPLEGATVILTGLGVKDLYNKTPHADTNGDGMVIFKGLKLRMTATIGYIDVEVSKPGYGENTSCRIAVIA